jgi:hypothetical protein
VVARELAELCAVGFESRHFGAGPLVFAIGRGSPESSVTVLQLTPDGKRAQTAVVSPADVEALWFCGQAARTSRRPAGGSPMSGTRR